ncbi:MAG: hypothetical protein K6E90_08905 [Lachnospiraceae bacterium]|nr:hypothetical protein [Lachnospiraceae bacterium]
MPSLGDIGNTAWSNIQQNAGVTEKAIIEVLDLSNRKFEKAEAIKVVGKSGAAVSNKGMGNTLANEGLLRDEFVSVTGNKVFADAYFKVMKKRIENSRRYFTVQFNPSSLQLSGHSGGMVQRLSYDKEDRNSDNMQDGSASYEPGPTTIIMSVSLLFDACDPANAFLDDKLTLNVTSVGKNAAKTLMTATGNKKTTVQTEVEGFIAALRNKNTRLITFNWGEFCYSGVLRSVGANYTMFSPGGLPIRATVDLSIVCADSDQWPHSLAVWQQRYKDAFSKGSQSYVHLKQQGGSLANLPSF